MLVGDAGGVWYWCWWFCLCGVSGDIIVRFLGFCSGCWCNMTFWVLGGSPGCGLFGGCFGFWVLGFAKFGGLVCGLLVVLLVSGNFRFAWVWYNIVCRFSCEC